MVIGAADHDLLETARLQLEIKISGVGSVINAKNIDEEQPIFPVIAEANDLFDIAGKGPRADHSYTQRYQQNIILADRRTEKVRKIAVEALKKNRKKQQLVSNLSEQNNHLKRQLILSKALSPIPWRMARPSFPLIDQNSAGQLLNIPVEPQYAGLKHNNPQPKRSPSDKKPKFTGLKVQTVALDGNKSTTFFGGLTENEFRKREKRCLATALYFEARSEPIKGQLAVAQVIMNRVRSSYFTDTVCGVVYEGAHKRNSCQFSFACDGLADKPKDLKRWAIAPKIIQ